MTYPDDILAEVSGRLVDDQEYMIIDPPEVEPNDEEED